MISPDRYPDAFAAACKRLRLAHGLTQERTAELAGVSVDSIRRHERGGRSISLVLAARLAQAFDARLAEVIASFEGDHLREPELIAAMNQLRGLDPTHLDLALVMLRALAERS